MTLRRTLVPWLGAVCAAALALAGCGGATTSSSANSVSTATTAPAAPAAHAAAVPGSDWLTFDADSQRTGVGPAHTGITASTVHRLGLRVVHLAGTVDSSPVELHNVVVHGHRRDVVVVTTTYGRTIALDAGTGRRLWEFTPRAISSYQGSAQVTTATPVADPDRRFIYAAAPNGFIHKLSITTGREARGWPVRITFDATKEKIASALNLSGGSVIAVTGGYIGDAPVYQGHVVLIDRASGRITHVFNTLCSNRVSLIDPPSACHESDSAIWARAGAVVEPGTGRLLVATGNADFNGSTDWGDSVLELSPGGRLLHNWTPSNEAALNASDGDLGSTAPAVLPRLGGRRLAVQGGKDAKLHVLDLDRLNGTTGGASRRLGGEVQNLSSPGGAEVLTAPAVWTHAGRTYVFVADDGGTAAYLAHGGAHPGVSLAWQNGTWGTSPVLAGGLLYVYDENGGALDVYLPASGHRVARLSAASGHWNSPIVAGGRIILPVGSYHDHATSGELYIWHLAGG